MQLLNFVTPPFLEALIGYFRNTYKTCEKSR